MGIKAIMGAQFGTLSLKKTTTTNPFEHNAFKGKSFTASVLPTDLFQSIKVVDTKPNKIKMISSAVIGSVTNFKTRLSESVVNFANNVKERISQGVEAVRSAKNNITEMGKNMQNRISQVFDWHKAAEENNNMPKILSARHINSKASVRDLEATWIAENEMIAKNADESRKAVA